MARLDLIIPATELYQEFLSRSLKQTVTRKRSVQSMFACRFMNFEGLTNYGLKFYYYLCDIKKLEKLEDGFRSRIWTHFMYNLSD
ncbi:hypothetical protein [Loigolactobacillus backii]|uniref:hypothetical protein n=1 Tax=Loigolactobacillus backii TaxID=375175 RepID=UPI0022FD591A|nr:hypothetical protein [Loigolactobacillus backii]MDA5391037.1 hypothetical protein [Loigolactobacillus backii]